MRLSGRAGRRPAADSARRDGFALTLTLLAVLAGVTFWAQLPAGFTPPWLADRLDSYAMLWTQNWEFFSSEPNTPQLTAYEVGQRGTTTPAVAPDTSAWNRWGLAHSTAAAFYELDTLAAEVPSGDWLTCAEPRGAACLAKLRTVVLPNDFQPAVLCGPMIIVRGQIGETGAGNLPTASVRVTCPR